MKGNNSRSTKDINLEIIMKVLVLANTYTGARFTNPPSKEQAFVLDACSRMVLRDYLSLSVSELDEAFSLAVSGKFEGLNIETYYGEFTPQILGKILKAYSIHRKEVLAEYRKESLLLKWAEDKYTKEQQEQFNLDAKNQIHKEYNEVKKIFNKDPLEFNAEMVKGSWAKRLVEDGVIVFTLEEKRGILEEAKQFCINKLKADKSKTNLGSSKRLSIKHTLKRVANGEKDNDFQSKVVAKYSRLLIIKSFVKNH
jgi:hypothetical protein